MAYVITGGCCGDASCIPVCPVQCIRPRPGDPDFTTAEQLYIDPQTCIDCGACMDECPVSAIHGEWDVPEELADFMAINSDYFASNPIEVSSPADPPRRALPAGREGLRVAVVGSGPAGCYAVSDLSEVAGVSVSLFDRLPTPFGLVRAGVAPDHVETKQITKRFGSVLSRPNVTCFLNVEVGKDVTLEELLEHHHAVIWAAGTGDDRRLDIPGEELPGSVSARELVGWYNGHPDHVDHTIDLAGESAVVIGNGNVALDVARVLAQPPEQLQRTDISDTALAALRESTVKQVTVTARRGPEHAAFTIGELLSLVHTPGVRVSAPSAEVGERSDPPRAVRILADAPAPDVPGSINFRFGLTPVRLEGTDRVEGVTFRRPDGDTETIAASLVVRAIGYRGTAVDGLPFDATTGTLPHIGGRVCDPDTGDAVPGVYCSGWIKRGPSGMIGTNKADSAETVSSLLHDFEVGRLPEPSGTAAALADLVAASQPHRVDAAEWGRIDAAERKAGRRARRPRQKLLTVDEMLEAAHG